MTRTALRTRRELAADDEGSTLVLTLGYAVLAIALIIVCVNATSLYLAQKRLDSIADSAALAGSDGFRIMLVDGAARAQLTDSGVQSQASAIVEAVGDGAVLVSAGTPDGVSSRVTVAETWHPPVFSFFVPSGVAIESTATSRTALH